MAKSIVKRMEKIKKTSLHKKESEDAYIINKELDIYGVLDGATPMDNFKDENGHNGAYLAANLFKDYFESLQRPAFIHEEVIRANNLLKSKMKHYQIDLSKKDRLWCTCVSVIQIIDDLLVYASLGDTMIIACDDQGQYNVLTINTVKNINCRADFNRKINRYKGENIPDETFFTNKQNKIRYNRFMANKPNGYSVANGMEEVKNTIQYGMLDTKNLKYVLIMSDGLFDLEEDIKTLFHEVINKGLAAYVEQLTAWEQEQGLSSDDKTAVLLHF